ncbi:2Fe-2S iron-sulfur cluster-binding protein [Parvibaculum sp.]|jgi:2Fe-2S ferredoxin|uniref:2Fe-2S iron-sulfur cluster-binding protein n=1 Tax=Parvibaculum sp. TaxID=2024848 RepID=UPI0034904845
MRIILVDGKGREHELEAVEGWRVMEIIRDYGFPIVAECGGACACGTCQVEVDPEWSAKLHEPREDELDQLDQNYGGEWSRLSCQLIMSAELDGLRLRLSDIAIREAA